MNETIVERDFNLNEEITKALRESCLGRKCFYKQFSKEDKVEFGAFINKFAEILTDNFANAVNKAEDDAQAIAEKENKKQTEKTRHIINDKTLDKLACLLAFFDKELGKLFEEDI